jgi:prepilin-type N-terminal cleavage/methylation domain-containing protein
MAYPKNNNVFNKGVTLVEVMVVSFIIAILFTIIGSIFITQNKLYFSENIISQLQRENLIAQHLITNQLKKSTEVLETTVLGINTYNSTANSTVFKIPCIDQDKNIIDNCYDYLALYLDSLEPNKLKIYTYADAQSSRITNEKTINDRVQEIIFEYSDSNFNQVSTVKITLTLEKEYKDRNYEFTLKTNATLRNFTSG